MTIRDNRLSWIDGLIKRDGNSWKTASKVFSANSYIYTRENKRENSGLSVAPPDGLEPMTSGEIPQIPFFILYVISIVFADFKKYRKDILFCRIFM